MCMNCGCGEPEERHDSPANITRSDLERAGEANGQTLAETMRNLQDAYRSIESEQSGSAAAQGSAQQ